MRKWIGLLGITLLQLSMMASSANTLSVKSNAAADNGSMPVIYTCDGKDISPEIAWLNTPNNTQSFALIASDPDAPNGIFYHWVLFNIPATFSELPEAITTFPSGTILGKNSWDKMEYKGPCPPKGASHHYIFTLYALDEKLNLKSGVDAEVVINAMKSHVVAQAVYTIIYSRWGD